MRTFWSDKVVLITGASSGIGRELAVEVGRRGAAVGLLARRAEALLKVGEEIEGAGGRALALPSDVRDANEVREAAGRMRERFGHIDIAVINAGVEAETPATRLSPDLAATIVSVNTIGAINSVCAVLPEMLTRKAGHLVAISSLAAYRGLPGLGAYCASKASLSTFFESLRIDLRRTGVKVTTIHPGHINTPMTEAKKERLPFIMKPEDAVKRIIRGIEKQRRVDSFPWQLAWLSSLSTLMPDALYERIWSNRLLKEWV